MMMMIINITRNQLIASLVVVLIQPHCRLWNQDSPVNFYSL